MPATTRILVTGCARSGNTLLSHLIAAGFDGVRLHHDAPHGEALPTDGAVGRFPRLLTEAARLLQESPELGVVLMMRDPRDVLTSVHPKNPNTYWVHPTRWIDCAKRIAELVDHPRCLLVRFESLLTKPEAVQEVIADRFGFAIRRQFADCPQHFEASDVEGLQAMHGARPLDPSRVGAWQSDERKRNYIEWLLKGDAELRQWAAYWSYEG